MGGGDKPLLLLAGRSMLDSIVDAWRRTTRSSRSARTVIPRAWLLAMPCCPIRSRGQGPLGGVLAGLEWAAELVRTRC